MEYWFYKKTNSLVKLSTQLALDCSKKLISDSDGCDGGLMEDVFKTAQTYPITLEKFDTFKQRDGTCPPPPTTPRIVVDTYTTMSDEWNDPIEQNLKHNLLSFGPIPVGIDTQSLNFELYSGGIMDGSHCGKDVDHAVAVVGYTQDYWIIKNSWGDMWGEHGYFKLKKGTNACGINSYSSFITNAHVCLNKKC
jgi:C1A family cysteine protease